MSHGDSREWTDQGYEMQRKRDGEVREEREENERRDRKRRIMWGRNVLT